MRIIVPESVMHGKNAYMSAGAEVSLALQTMTKLKHDNDEPLSNIIFLCMALIKFENNRSPIHCLQSLPAYEFRTCARFLFKCLGRFRDMYSY